MRVVQPLPVEEILRQAKILHTRGEVPKAEQAYLAVLSVQPDHLDALFNLGNLFAMVGHHEGAAHWFRKVLAVDPNHAGALDAIGIMEDVLGHLESAEAFFRRAISIAGNNPMFHHNLGNCLRHQNRLDEALAEFDSALAIDPDHRDSLLNKADIHALLGQQGEAENLVFKALQSHPDDPFTRWQYGIHRFRRGDYLEGWKYLDARLQVEPPPLPEGRQRPPLWDGRIIPGLRLVVRTEQGFGDVLQFIRCVRNLSQKGLDLDIELAPNHTPLSGLLQEQPWMPRIISNPMDIQDHEFSTRLMSLPRTLDWCDDDTIRTESQSPYLAPNPELVRAWDTKVRGCSGKKVGVVWAGNPLSFTDAQRNLHFDCLIPLWEIPDVFWFSLQKDNRNPPWPSDLPAGRWLDRTSDLIDFHHTAGLIANLDAVVTIDSAVAHLAGAMGKPVFLMLPLGAEWRWMLDRSDSPWYPHHRLFRQSKAGDWAGVIKDVKDSLGGFLKGL